ncbi:MAG: hypothetical protein M2R45_04472 [Verrucomicrobia subdivision 3 bacterium]|nr:hypothetical protein [Limisphaerales bacterium]MCS1414997.1 hypothetical protein [Limisphaerales bacterium]
MATMKCSTGRSVRFHSLESMLLEGFSTASRQPPRSQIIGMSQRRFKSEPWTWQVTAVVMSREGSPLLHLDEHVGL